MKDRVRQVKLYLGAMSLNSVDAFLRLSKNQKNKIGLISSRRQIDFSTGYVNNWSTAGFFNYVRELDKNLLLCRDHGGPEQGTVTDEGWSSLEDDSKYFDIIHIDPWKKYKSLDEGSDYTIQAIKRLCQLSKTCLFEVGTEEAIRSFTPTELQIFLDNLKDGLAAAEFNRIAYCVVQSGVGLDLVNQKNTGTFDEDRLLEMLRICKNFSVLSKEHNADYLTSNELKRRFDLGLDAANIAPEIGQIETKIYLETLDESTLENVYHLCLDSKKWEKWVDKDFDSEDREKLIQVCGHYVFSHSDFPQPSEILKKEIVSKIQNKIARLLNTDG